MYTNAILLAISLIITASVAQHHFSLEGSFTHEQPIHVHAYPKYEYKYDVSDSHTHDYHSQHEVRDGDVVHGEYSLHEPDGTLRIVKYTADHKNGFNAQVIKQGHAGHPENLHQNHFTHHGRGYGGY